MNVKHTSAPFPPANTCQEGQTRILQSEQQWNRPPVQSAIPSCRLSRSLKLGKCEPLYVMMHAVECGVQLYMSGSEGARSKPSLFVGAGGFAYINVLGKQRCCMLRRRLHTAVVSSAGYFAFPLKVALSIVDEHRMAPSC